VSAVSRELGISVSAATQIADRLQRAGMVERIRHPEDRRVRGLSLTPHGREAMQARRQRRVERIQAALGGISPARRGEILDAMRTLLAAAEDLGAGKAGMDRG
jgi:DNA-binding MarR family transcriptional regulator